MSQERNLNKASIYEIRVKGNLASTWSDWFNGFEIVPQRDNETLLVGPVVDQPALHGLLAKIRNLGLPVVLVKWVEGEKRD